MTSNLSLSNLVARMRPVSPPVDLRMQMTCGRLYVERVEGIWLAEISKRLFISADKKVFHQLNISGKFEGPQSNGRPHRVLLTQTPGLLSFIVGWYSAWPTLFYSPQGCSTLKVDLQRTAAQETLMNGAFYLCDQREVPEVPASLQSWWNELIYNSFPLR